MRPTGIFFSALPMWYTFFSEQQQAPTKQEIPKHD